MKGKHVRAIRNEKIDAGLPAAGNQRLKAMRAMFRWGVEEEECETNPTIGVQKHGYQTDGHHQWTDEQMAQYRAFYPLGTKQRVAIDLVSYTSCRREDVVRIGPQHRRNGRLVYRQAKNEHRNPIDLDIPVHPKLAESLDAFTSDHLIWSLSGASHSLSKASATASSYGAVPPPCPTAAHCTESASTPPASWPRKAQRRTKSVR